MPMCRSRRSITRRLPHPDFAGKTGHGDFADCLAEMDHHVGQIVDAVKELGIDDNTIIVFTSDNGPEELLPWRGWAGPWAGSYFTAMEGSLRVPFIVRWPGKVPAGRVSNEIVHDVGYLHHLRQVCRGRHPQGPHDRRRGPEPISSWAEQDKSNREGFPCYVNGIL